MFRISSSGTTLMENGVSCRLMLPRAPTDEMVLALYPSAALPSCCSSVVKSTSRVAVTCTCRSVLSASLVVVARMTTALPYRAADSPLPASNLSSACCKVRCPDTVGAVILETRSPDASTCAPVWRDSSFNAAASGCAGTLMLKVGSVACVDDCAEARLLQLKKVVPNAAASAAFRSRWRGEERMGQGSGWVNATYSCLLAKGPAKNRSPGASQCKTLELAKQRPFFLTALLGSAGGACFRRACGATMPPGWEMAVIGIVGDRTAARRAECRWRVAGAGDG